MKCSLNVKIKIISVVCCFTFLGSVFFALYSGSFEYRQHVLVGK